MARRLEDDYLDNEVQDLTDVVDGVSNRAPELDGVADVTMAEGQQRTVTVTARDADGDGLVFSLADESARMSATASGLVSIIQQGNGTATLQITADTDGQSSVTVQVCDPGGLCDHVTFTVVVTNAAPGAVPGGPYSVPWGVPVGLDVSATDPSASDAASLTFEWDVDGNGTFDTAPSAASGATGTYPEPGNLSPKVRVCDDDTCVVAAVSVQVTVHPTALVYTGATAVQYSDALALQAQLVDTLVDVGIGGSLLTLEVGSQGTTITTGPSGQGSAVLVITQPAGTPSGSVSYSGSTYYQPASAAIGVTIGKENATISHTGPANFVSGAGTTLEATFVDASDGNPGDRTLAGLVWVLHEAADCGLPGSTVGPTTVAPDGRSAASVVIIGTTARCVGAELAGSNAYYMAIPATRVIAAWAGPPVEIADLAVAKVAHAQTATLAGTLSWTITVTNHGPEAASSVVLTDALPPELDLVSVTPGAPGWDCSASHAGAPALVDCRIASLASGASATFDVVTTVVTLRSQDIVNSATAATTSDEVTLANNVGQATVRVEELPSTGAAIGSALWQGLASLALGLGLVGASRRRRRR